MGEEGKLAKEIWAIEGVGNLTIHWVGVCGFFGLE